MRHLNAFFYFRHCRTCLVSRLCCSALSFRGFQQFNGNRLHIPMKPGTNLPGYSIHLIQQNVARSHDLPCSLLSCRLFIRQLLQFCFLVSSAYIFTLTIRLTSTGWWTLLGVLSLPVELNPYALRRRTVDTLSSVLASQRLPILPTYCPHIAMRRGHNMQYFLPTSGCNVAKEIAYIHHIEQYFLE